MRTRILLTPEADGSGGGDGTPPTPPMPQPANPPTPTGITITADEYRKLIDNERRLADLEAEKDREVEAERQKAVDALAAKGQVEEALKKERDDSAAKLKSEQAKSAQIEAERLSDKKSESLSAALVGADFISEEAAGQVRTILSERFEAVRDSSGQVVVREKGTLKPVGEVVKAWLASTAGAHFIKPTSRGGSGAKGGDQPPPADDGSKPQRADDVIVAHLKTKRADQPKVYGLGRRAAPK